MEKNSAVEGGKGLMQVGVVNLCGLVREVVDIKKKPEGREVMRLVSKEKQV